MTTHKNIQNDFISKHCSSRQTITVTVFGVFKVEKIMLFRTMCKKGSYKTHIKANCHLNCQFIKLENFG